MCCISRISRMRFVVVLLLVGVRLADAGKHSLRYFYTAVSGVSDFPEFTSVGLLDDEQITYFDSKTKKTVPKTEWIRQNVGADYWDKETQIDIGHHQFYLPVKYLFTQRQHKPPGGVHTYQWMYGCELTDDGTKQGYEQHGYDGEDFLSLDMSSFTWTAANPQAMITKVKWDSTRAQTNRAKAYLENTCIEWLQKYVVYGKDSLERKVSPQVSLRQKSSSSSVSCHATGFHPKEVTISWQKNGQDHDEDVDLGELLPNEDGTFQKTSTLRVSPDELKKNQFSCVVEHQGKTIREILTDRVINNGSLPIGIIVGVVVAVLLLAVIGVVVFMVLQKKKKPDYKLVNASDDGSNNS